jgi:hypothetical protein
MEIKPESNIPVMVKTGVKTLPRYFKNPFLTADTILNTKQKIHYSTVKKGRFGDIDTGEIHGDTLNIAVQSEYDSESFIKVYAGMSRIWYDMSNVGMKAFALVFAAIQESIPGATFVYIHNLDPRSRHFLASNGQFYKGIHELVNLNIIARHRSEHWYWVNPFVMCRTNRIRILQDVKLEKKLESNGLTNLQLTTKKHRKKKDNNNE